MTFYMEFEKFGVQCTARKYVERKTRVIGIDFIVRNKDLVRLEMVIV